MVPSYLQIQVAILVIWHGEVLDMNMMNLPVLHERCKRGAVLRGGRLAQVEMRCAVNRRSLGSRHIGVTTASQRLT
jgi:hypothetical protein